MATNPAQNLLDSKMTPSVAIIILNWNGCKDTLQCLADLKKLTFANCSTTVVDNGSTDDSVAKIRQAHPNVEIVLNGKNLGFAAGNNIAIHRTMNAGADYIWLLNNDTSVQPSCLSEMLSVAQSDRAIAGVGCLIYSMKQPDELLARGGGRISLTLGINWHCRRTNPSEKLDYLTGASMLLRAEAIREVGLLDEGYFLYWEDADLCMRFRKTGWKLAVANKAVIHHKEGASHDERSVERDRIVTQSAVRFFRSHAPSPRTAIVLGTVIRAAKRLMRFQWRRCAAVVSSALEASRSQNNPGAEAILTNGPFQQEQQVSLLGTIKAFDQNKARSAKQ